MTRQIVAVTFGALVLQVLPASASTSAPSVKPKMWRDKAIKCVPVDPNEPEGAKDAIPTLVDPTYHAPFTTTTWTFRFLNADLQATWSQDAITAVADAAKHWSNVTGSSIQGVFDWSMSFETQDPSMVASGVTTSETICNGESDIFYVDNLSSFCSGTGNTYGCVRHMYEEKK